MIPRLSEKLQHFHNIAQKISVPAFVKSLPEENNQIISHLWFWPRLSYFFKAQDVIVTETGTANFGILDIPLPAGAILVSQILWGSIGWSVGA